MISLSLQLSQCRQQDPATVQGAALQNWSSFPRSLPGIYALIFSVGLVILSALFLPVMPAPRNVWVPMHSRRAGLFFWLEWRRFCPEYLFQQVNGGDLRNNSLLTSSVNSVTFSWQTPWILSQDIVSAVQQTQYCVSVAPGLEWGCCVRGSRRRDVLQRAVLLEPANGEGSFHHTRAPASQGSSWVVQPLEVSRQLGNNQVGDLEKRWQEMLTGMSTNDKVNSWSVLWVFRS